MSLISNLTIVNNRTQIRSRSMFFGLATMAIAIASPASAANISDAASCSEAVAQSEKAIIQATLSADNLNILVSLADQAKSACAENDFAKASKLTDAIVAKIAEVAIK